MLYRDPCVFVVGNDYQIVFNALETGIAWVEIGSDTYRDSENGLMRSESLVHKITVPMRALDQAGEYRVCFRALPERRPYFPELGDIQCKTYAFQPICAEKKLHAMVLADTHSKVEAPCRAAQHFGQSLDLLILIGDIPAESKHLEDIRAIYDITSNITGGHLPVVFARGNHDYRGRYATELPQYIGTRNGQTWFTFRIGGLWGIVLDCGEDKMDSDVEYGGLVDCQYMRREETEFLRSVIDNREHEYLAPGVTTRIAFSHIPFCAETMGESDPKFDIERELYAEWTSLLNQMKLDAMLSGHTHRHEIIAPDSARMRYQANFPVLICSEPIHPDRSPEHPQWPGKQFIATALTIEAGKITPEFVSD